MTAVQVRDLTVEYRPGGPETTIRPLDGLDLDLAGRSLVALRGPSGSGKTTLLSCLAAILKPTAGTVRVGDQTVTSLSGRDLVRYRRHGVGVIFQSFNLLPSLTALENVMVPLVGAGERRQHARRRATELLDLVGLEDRAAHLPGRLSGGQQQRVAIARALVHAPPLLVADEPTAHLDPDNVAGVMQLLGSLARAGHLVLVATHDDRVTARADRVVDLTATAQPRVRSAG